MWLGALIFLASHLGTDAFDDQFDAHVLLQVPAQQRAAEGPAETNSALSVDQSGTTAHKTERILIFWAVGSKPRGMHLIKQNVEHLREFEKLTSQLQFDIYFAHYDRKRDVWRANNSDWYDQNIRFFCEQEGLKFPLAKRALIDDTSFPLDDYSWVWFLDEDGDIRHLDPGTLINIAERSRGNVVTPSLLFERGPHEESKADMQVGKLHSATELEFSRMDCQPHDGKCVLQAPKPNCRYRYGNFVEVSFPLMRPKTWRALATTPKVVNQESVWGLDHIWCHMSARLHNTTSEKSCVIVDVAPITHLNLKTLPKYRDSTQWGLGWNSMRQMKMAFPQDFIGGLHEYKCVSSDRE